MSVGGREPRHQCREAGVGNPGPPRTVNIGEKEREDSHGQSEEVD